MPSSGARNLRGRGEYSTAQEHVAAGAGYAGDGLVREQYETALEALVTEIKRDPYALAAILLGSLAYDTVWAKSDIDLLVITQETKRSHDELNLVTDGVNVHACLQTRSEFKKILGGAIHGSFMHSLLMRGRILFSRDETIDEMFANREHVGSRDREIRLLSLGSSVLPALAKAQKWLHVKGDVHYTFLWILRCLDTLASIEVAMHGEVGGREVIHQAMRHNPELFGRIYTDLIEGPKIAPRMQAALDEIEGYLRAHTCVIFAPLLSYLGDAGGVRSSTEIGHYFKNQMNLGSVDSACEWLADEGVIHKVSAPVRLTEKSRIDVPEAAYYYDGDR